MSFLQRFLSIGLMASVIAGFTVAHADTVSEISITRDGLFSAKKLSVIQKSGTNLFTRASWDQAFIRVIVLVNASTTISKNHGERILGSDIKEGDLLDVDGTLSTGADSILVNAVKIRDISQEKESQTISGIVQGINGAERSFILPNKSFGNTKVVVSASVHIQKGARSIEFDDVSAGDRILSAPGTYDYVTNTLSASALEVYQEKTMFTPRNFQGTLKNISTTTLPSVMTVNVQGTDYNVYLTDKSAVLKKNRGATTLVRFVAGDAVRIYGKIRQTNFSEIDAEIVRDLNF